MDFMRSAGLLLGRFLLSGIFLMSGAMKCLQWQPTSQHMADEGMVQVPLFLALAIAVELGAGLMVLLGLGARLGAVLLALFLVPVTAIFHDFWTYQGEAMQNQMQHFSKNVTIIGGLVTLAAAGAGRFSWDAWMHRRRAHLRPISAGRTEGADWRQPRPEAVDEINTRHSSSRSRETSAQQTSAQPTARGNLSRNPKSHDFGYQNR